ncbi:MAG TPA: hypothetical protein VGN24_03200 [Rhodanobacter sp.]|nr:hypothetical protein [Rhodanobacter sp.]
MARQPIGAQHGERVIADVVAVDVADERGDLALGHARQRDAAALATLVDQHALAHEAGAPVVGSAVVNRGTEIGPARRRGGNPVAFVDPSDHDAVVAIHRQCIEAVGDFGAVVVHGGRRAEREAVVVGVAEAHLAVDRINHLQPAVTVECCAGTQFGACGHVHVHAFMRQQPGRKQT